MVTWFLWLGARFQVVESCVNFLYLVSTMNSIRQGHLVEGQDTYTPHTSFQSWPKINEYECTILYMQHLLTSLTVQTAQN